MGRKMLKISVGGIYNKPIRRDMIDPTKKSHTMGDIIDAIWMK
jgi:hypothetical protein